MPFDDHLLRDVLIGDRSPDLGGLAGEGLATTLLWLSASFADPAVIGKLSGPVAALPEGLQTAFRAQLIGLPDEIEVLSMRDLAWSVAELQTRHLAAAHRLGAAIAVSRHDVRPNLEAAAQADHVDYHIL